jgi:hypothetical protein
MVFAVVKHGILLENRLNSQMCCSIRQTEREDPQNKGPRGQTVLVMVGYWSCLSFTSVLLIRYTRLDYLSPELIINQSLRVKTL